MLSKLRKLFTDKEIYGLLVVGVFIGFMLFIYWGNKTTTVLSITTLIITIFISLISLIIHLLSQKVIGKFMGYAVNWEIEPKGLVSNLIIWLLSNLKIFPIPIYGSITLEPIQELRFGKKPGFKFYHLGWTAVSGCIANLILALLLKYIWIYTESSIIEYFIFINMLIAFFMSLPLPFTDGIHLFFASRLDYVTYLATMVFFCILLLTPLGIEWLVVLTALFAVCAWVAYWMVEKKLK